MEYPQIQQLIGLEIYRKCLNSFEVKTLLKQNVFISSLTLVKPLLLYSFKYNIFRMEMRHFFTRPGEYTNA